MAATTATKVRYGLFVRLEAKAGKENDLARFLESARPLVEEEPATISWYAFKMGPTTFGIFDTFPDEAGRQAHLFGKVPAALMAKEPELLKLHLEIEKVEILTAKLPH